MQPSRSRDASDVFGLTHGYCKPSKLEK